MIELRYLEKEYLTNIVNGYQVDPPVKQFKRVLQYRTRSNLDLLQPPIWSAWHDVPTVSNMNSERE